MEDKSNWIGTDFELIGCALKSTIDRATNPRTRGAGLWDGDLLPRALNKVSELVERYRPISDTHSAGIGFAHAWLLEYDAKVEVSQRKPPDRDAFKLVMRITWNYNGEEHGIESALEGGMQTINDVLYDLVGAVISRFPLPPDSR